MVGGCLVGYIYRGDWILHVLPYRSWYENVRECPRRAYARARHRLGVLWIVVARGANHLGCGRGTVDGRRSIEVETKSGGTTQRRVEWTEWEMLTSLGNLHSKFNDRMKNYNWNLINFHPQYKQHSTITRTVYRILLPYGNRGTVIEYGNGAYRWFERDTVDFGVR